MKIIQIAKKVGPYLLALLLILLILYISRGQLTKFVKIKNISALSAVWISLLFVVNQIINGYRLKIFMGLFDVKLSFAEWFGLISVQSFGNYLPLSGGLISNMAYLKAKKKLPVSKYVSYLAGDMVIKLLAYGIIGLMLFFVGSIINYDFNPIISITLLSFVIFSLICIFISPSIKQSSNLIINWIYQIHNGWNQIRTNNQVIIKSVLTHLIILITISLQYNIIFKELDHNIPIIPIIILTIMSNVIRVAVLFPGNLGIRESISGSVTSMFGFSFGLGVFASLVGRVISMFWIFLLGIIFSFILIGKRE